MRIMHIVLVPRVSGAEVLVTDLAALGAKEGHDISVVSLGPSESSFQPFIDKTSALGVKWIVPDVMLTKCKRVSWTRTAVKMLHPDVVIAHSVIPSRYARLALMWAKHPKIISVLHSASQNEYGGGGITALVEKIQKNRANAIVTVSSLAAKNYAKSIGSHKRLETIPNGIKIQDFKDARQNRAAIRNKLGVGEGEVLLLQVGRFNSIKRQHLTVAAIQKAHLSGQRLHVVFVGIEEDQEYSTSLRDQVDGMGIKLTVQFLGPRNDIADLLAASDIYVMPSSAEAHSVAFLEGLASGAAVVASSIEVFQFAKKMPGVWLCNVENEDAYAEAIADAIRAGLTTSDKGFDRELSQFDITKTHNNYLELARSI